MKTKLGFIGLGEMGLPMAKNLVKKGFPLTVYDLDPEPLKQLEAMGAVTASGPASVAENSDLVMVIVRTTEQVRKVLFGDKGVVSAAMTPSAVAVMSTISPVEAGEMAVLAKEKNIEFLDAPVSGARERAETGKLTIMVGGETDVFQKFLPVFDTLGSKIVHVGGVGAGEYAKLINNMFLLVHMCAAYEAVSLAESEGMDPSEIFDIVKSGTGQSWVVDNWETVRGWKKNYFEGGTLDLIYKDIDITLSIGEKKKVPLYLSSLSKQLGRY
jgi:3-hydroxyisobutyrate dehydrogenase-like beta-hydroxyacid dehydrogenase